MTEFAVMLSGLMAIALIVWWFWLSRPRPIHAGGHEPVDILVKDGTYQPAVIECPSGQALTLRFVRQDATPCAEKVVFDDLGVSADLPLGRPQTVNLGKLPSGSHEFTCQMGMYRGKLIVKP